MPARPGNETLETSLFDLKADRVAFLRKALVLLVLLVARAGTQPPSPSARAPTRA